MAESYPPYIEVVSGPDTGKRFVLRPGDTTVGRSYENECVLSDPAVSRKHCVLRRTDQGVALRDLSSGNGCLLNGVRVSEARVDHGDRIEIGETLIAVRIPERIQKPAPQRAHSFKEALTTGVREGLRVARRLVPPPVPLEARKTMMASALPRSALPQASAYATPSAPPAVRRPRWLILAIVAFTVIAAAGVGAVIAALIAGGEKPDAAPAADSRMQLAWDAYRAQHWDVAERVLNELHDDYPKDPQVSELRTRVGQARADVMRLERARAAEKAEDSQGVLRALEGVSAGSPIKDEVDQLTKRAVDALIAVYVAEAKAARSVGHERTADAALAKARALKADHPLLRGLAEGAPEGAGRASAGAGKVGDNAPNEKPTAREGRAPVAVRATPERHISPPVVRDAPLDPGARERVLADYRRGDFEGAMQRAREYAEQGRANTRAQFSKLAHDIERFRDAYEFGQSGEGEAALTQLKEAKRLDHAISGGSLERDIDRLMGGAYVREARAAWSEQRYTDACQAVRRGLMLADGDRALVWFKKRCNTRAEEVLAQADDIARHDPARARALLRDVLSMATPESAVHRDAYELYQELSSAGR